MTCARLLTGLLFAVALTTAANATNNGPTLQDRQQAACYDDVQRLCGNFMPDVDKVTACMKPKKDLVSDKCRALWDVK